ncbi:hypothetical protein SUT007_00340 [Streptococcus parasuis]|nr:hypothetical protein SUT007_00340 [Streptococcus parasuis]
MISTDVDDYSLCLLTIIYLQNNFDDNKFLERIKNLFSEVHHFYEDNRSRMTEKLWFFRYFIYILIRNNSKWKKIVLTKYKKSELDYIFILSSGTNEQKSVNKLVFLHGAVRNFGFVFVFFFQAEDGIRDDVESRGLGDVYKRQVLKETK